MPRRRRPGFQGSRSFRTGCGHGCPRACAGALESMGSALSMSLPHPARGSSVAGSSAEDRTDSSLSTTADGPPPIWAILPCASNREPVCALHEGTLIPGSSDPHAASRRLDAEASTPKGVTSHI